MKIKNLSAIIGVSLASGSIVFAADPSVTTFGPQPLDTFASHTIDNTQVESTTITDAGNLIKLDLTSTPRGITAPPVNNNGNGTFFAQPGHTVQFGLNLPLWSFDYSITVNNSAFSNYTYLLIYGNGTSTASFNPAISGVPDDSNTTLAGLTSQQNDENLGFATGAAGGFPALPTGFNPDANGRYTFTLEALSGGAVIGSDAITVNVSPVPDAASTLPLLGLGFAGLAALRRRFNRA